VVTVKHFNFIIYINGDTAHSHTAALRHFFFFLRTCPKPVTRVDTIKDTSVTINITRSQAGSEQSVCCDSRHGLVAESSQNIGM